jgi:hypothetical protein
MTRSKMVGEAREAACGRSLHARPDRPGASDFKHVDGRPHPLHRHGAERLDCDVALSEAEGIDRQTDTPGERQLLHPPGEVRRLAHGGPPGRRRGP